MCSASVWPCQSTHRTLQVSTSACQQGKMSCTHNVRSHSMHLHTRQDELQSERQRPKGVLADRAKMSCSGICCAENAFACKQTCKQHDVSCSVMCCAKDRSTHIVAAELQVKVRKQPSSSCVSAVLPRWNVTEADAQLLTQRGMSATVAYAQQSIYVQNNTVAMTDTVCYAMHLFCAQPYLQPKLSCSQMQRGYMLCILHASPAQSIDKYRQCIDK